MQSFQENLNARIQESLNAWWNSLTKDEILDYLKGQPQITADYLRTMLSNEGITLQFGTSFNCVDQSIATEV